MSTEKTLTACHECDLLQTLPHLPAGSIARCGRCGARLCGNPKGGILVPFALSATGLVLYLIANIFPLVELNLQGRRQATTLSGTALALADQGMPVLALAVWLTSVLVPGLTLAVSFYVLWAAHWKPSLAGARALWGWIARLRPWGMVDVFMLGVLVALVKLGAMAQVVVGPGLYGFVPLLLVSAAVAATVEPRLVWERLEGARHEPQ